MSEAENSISSFYYKIDRLQQSNLYKRLLQSPSSWVEMSNREEINLAYELETYGLVNINPTSEKDTENGSVRVKIVHS